MLSLKVALRFLLTTRGQTLLICTGIAIGVAVTIFIGSLIASLQDFLIEQTLGSSPHLTITAESDGELVEYSDDLDKAVRRISEIVVVLPVRTVSALYREGSQSAGVAVKSGEAEPLDDLYKLEEKVVKGRYRIDDGGLLIGLDLAEKFSLDIDDSMPLTLPTGGTETRTVSGIFDLGSGELNEKLAFAGAAFAADELGYMDNEYNAIELQLNDVFASTDIAGRLETETRNIIVSDWQVEQEDLLSGLQAQSSSTLMIQVFVVIAIALGIASTLSISAMQKTRQIGILKAMGMSDGRSGLIFLWQGALLGLIGTTSGVILGLGLIRLFQLISSSSSNTLFPIEAKLGFTAIAWAIGLLVAMFSAVFPARRTANLDAIDVIQNG